jgi:hypothetical protein
MICLFSSLVLHSKRLEYLHQAVAEALISSFFFWFVTRISVVAQLCASAVVVMIL